MPRRRVPAPPAVPSAAEALEAARLEARLRRGFRLERDRLKPWFAQAPMGTLKGPVELLAWLRARDPALAEAVLARGVGRPRRPVPVTPAQSLEGLPARVWHGSRNRDALLLDGVRLAPAASLGDHGARGYGWARGTWNQAAAAWRWWQSLSPAGRRTVEAQVGRTIASAEDLGEAVSLLFVMSAGPLYAAAYTPEPDGGAVLELDPRRLPLLGYFEDPTVVGRSLGLVLPARGYQGGPDAVTGIYERPWDLRENPPSPEPLRLEITPGYAPRGLAAVGIVGFRGRVAVARIRVEELDPRHGVESWLSSADCAADYRAACEAEGRPLRIFMVGFAEVLDPNALGQGLGVELYTAAATWAGERDGVLVPMRCVIPQSTTGAAERVWASRRFAERVRRFGSVAWAPPAERRPNPGPRVPMVSRALLPELARHGAVIRPLRELPRAAQLAVGQYERESGRESAEAAARRLAARPFGYVELPMAVLTRRIGEDLAARRDRPFASFEAFHRWFSSTGLPDHPATDPWPVILERPEPHAEGVLEDGWHRLADYYRKGLAVVPAVFYVGPERVLR